MENIKINILSKNEIQVFKDDKYGAYICESDNKEDFKCFVRYILSNCNISLNDEQELKLINDIDNIYKEIQKTDE